MNGKGEKKQGTFGELQMDQNEIFHPDTDTQKMQNPEITTDKEVL